MTDPKTLQPLFRCRGSDIKDPDNVLAELGWHPVCIVRLVNVPDELTQSACRER